MFESLAMNVATWFGLVASIIACLIVCTVRGAVRKRDNIPTQICGDAEDACCAFFCNPCAQCQIFNHEGVTCEKYSLCTPTGSPVAESGPKAV